MALDTVKAQEAIVGALRGDNVCGGKIYDFLPESPSRQQGASGQSYPFCVLDDLRVEEDDVGREKRSLLFQVVQVWTRAGGKQQAQAITDQIKDLFHTNVVGVSDGTSLRFVWENTQLFNDADRQAYRGVMRFRINHEEDC
ncbi:MAG: DUF3168 domain-containing protein [Cohaesibacter sp.]|nr:DUF3168 domain-containing protein [Cohaesibacter sp.]